MRRGVPIRSGRRGLIAGAAAAIFLVCGVALIGAALASQRGVPQSPLVSDDPSTPPNAESTGHGAVDKPKAEVHTLPRSLPVSLKIPAIDVRSDIQKVGRTADGALETPAPGPYYDDAAWYRHSPTPGSLGPAILVGHVDSAANGPSVFFRLGDLRPGDRISVTRADDSVATFVVDEVHRYAKDDFPTRTVYGDIDHAGLRIITCGGAFDDAAGHYLDNVVVFASLLGERH